MDAINEAVREALAKTPVTLRELARLAGVPSITLSHIVNGHRSASLNVARAVADALDAIAQESTGGATLIRRSLTTNPRKEE